MIHSSFRTGAKIRIIMRDGSQVIAKFKEHKRNTIITEDKGNFDFRVIRAVSYYKKFPFEIEM